MKIKSMLLKLIPLVCFVTIASAQSYSLQFTEATEEQRVVLCAPILKKVHDRLMRNLLANKIEGGDIGNGRLVAFNVGYRAEVFSIMAAQNDSELLKKAWKDSAELNDASLKTKSKWTSVCLDLYNKLKREHKINLNIEKFANAIVETQLADRLGLLDRR
jgi:hypothetical protein